MNTPAWTPAPPTPYPRPRGHIHEVSPGVVVVRPSMMATIGTFAKWMGGVLLFLVTITLFTAPFAMERGDIWYLWVVENLQFGVSLLLPLVPAVRLAFTTYTVDAEGVRVRSQVLATQDHRVPWAKVTAVGHRRTLIDRVLGIERVDVIAYGMRGATLHLVGLREGPAVRRLVAGHARRHCTVTALSQSD